MMDTFDMILVWSSIQKKLEKSSKEIGFPSDVRRIEALRKTSGRNSSGEKKEWKIHLKNTFRKEFDLHFFFSKCFLISINSFV